MTHNLIRINQGKRKIVNINDILIHPLVDSTNDRRRFHYKFLRITRPSTGDRPDSGRILVENLITGKRTEHYSILFNTRVE